MKLGDLLPDKLDSLTERARAALCEDGAVKGMSLAWDYVGARLREALCDALDCDLLDVFGKGWAGAELLLEYCDPSRHPPGERSVVELGAHEVGHELNPVVGVTIAPCPCIELKFSFAVTGHFGGVKLAIVDGHIIGGETGDAWASAQLSLEGVALHEPRESRKLSLPGSFTFPAPGIPLRAAA